MDLKYRESLASKKVLVVGLARSGLAAANFLLRSGALVKITDIKPADELEDAVAQLAGPAELQFGEHREEDFLRSELIILSPGVPRTLPILERAAAKGIPIWSEVELGYRFLDGYFIGITGSNGKTTTATLAGKILRSAGIPVAVAGNIGTPLSLYLQNSHRRSPKTTYVVELSSFQLETVSEFRSKIALLLNVTPDHMDRYVDFEDYWKAKRRVFLNQTSQDHAVINLDDSYSSRSTESIRSNVFPFSRTTEVKQGVCVRNDWIWLRNSGESCRLMPVDQIRLQGTHNLENVLAASATAYLHGVEPNLIARAVAEFRGVEHRLEPVREVLGVEYYNDSKATNLDSAIKAIRSFDRPLVLIMGGFDKGTDYSPLPKSITSKVKHVILIGQAADKIHSVLKGHVPTTRAHDMAEAVQTAAESAGPGDIVLLAPACASFDMFANYEERGHAFKEVVNALLPLSSEKAEESVPI
jgi:UDP-N-acetylmuramoylalanine--D-glutamate ligase